MPRIVELNRQTQTSESAVTTWVDLDLRAPEDNLWLEKQSGLPTHLLEHLQSRIDFSRREIIGDGLLICFQSRIRNPGQQIHNDRSIRLWIEKNRVITARAGSSANCDALYEAARAEPEASWSPFELVSFLVRNNLMQLEPLISEIVGQVGNLEDEYLADDETVTIENLSDSIQVMMRTRRT